MEEGPKPKGIRRVWSVVVLHCFCFRGWRLPVPDATVLSQQRPLRQRLHKYITTHSHEATSPLTMSVVC